MCEKLKILSFRRSIFIQLSLRTTERSELLNDDFRVYLTAYHHEVTGSRLVLNAVYPDGRKQKIMVDCGYYQEVNYRYLNYEHELNPENIDVILITHNHIDHTGLLPKMAKEGFNGPIYMTQMTYELLPSYLQDSARQQPENAEYLRKKYPNDAYKFDVLYNDKDVQKVLPLAKGVDYRKTIEVLPGVKVTFYENGHLLGAACILVQFTCYGKKPLNFLFTGDYRSRNPLFFVPVIPKAVRKMELIIVCESTYGGVESQEIRKCFEKNMMEAFSKRMNVLIGAFAQGRMQEILNVFRIMQEEGKIPPEYEICIDGGLGISTCLKYMSLLRKYYPKSPNFMPEGVRVLDADSRSSILDSQGLRNSRKIVITTSGMLSNGPAREHVPNFLERYDCMIHLCGYAAEETIARQLLDTIRLNEVTIRGNVYQKNAVVKTTREFTSHAASDELIKFLSQFKNVRFVAVNHGSTVQSRDFAHLINDTCPNVEEVGRINRNNMYCFVQRAKRGAGYEDIEVKALPAKFKISYNYGKSDNSKNSVQHHKKTSRDGRERRR